MGAINRKLSYLGITSKSIANTFINKMIIKYCFNTGDVSGESRAGGVITFYTNTLGDSTFTSRGGKSSVEIAYNYNAGKISTINDAFVGGITYAFQEHINGDNCYCDAIVSNNFNIGDIRSNVNTSYAGGIIGFLTLGGAKPDSLNANFNIKSCYNYSTNIVGGQTEARGGIFGSFYACANASRISLSNNYSAYKRKNNESVELDSNVHGVNLASPNGANVGEIKKPFAKWLTL